LYTPTKELPVLYAYNVSVFRVHFIITRTNIHFKTIKTYFSYPSSYPLFLTLPLYFLYSIGGRLTR
jgi:hypothetical protein